LLSDENLEQPAADVAAIVCESQNLQRKKENEEAERQKNNAEREVVAMRLKFFLPSF
jgi:hypothetical protein